jgi:hypothetical protein
MAEVCSGTARAGRTELLFQNAGRGAALGGASFGFVLDSGEGGGLIAPAE